MAWVLVAVGALMAAAGLYVIGYSALNTRFEEYWTAMTAGATLVAGGIVTVALGFATRALRDLGAALSVRPVVVPAPPPAGIEPPASLPSIEPDHPLEPAAPTLSALQPPIPPQQSEASPPIETPMPTHAAQPFERPHEAEAPAPFVAAAYEPAVAADPVPPEPPPPAAPPASAPLRDDEIADGSPAMNDDAKPEPPTLPAAPRTPVPHEMPDDWLDRAFADLDQELPISVPAPSRPPVRPYRQDVPARTEGAALPKAPTLEPVEAAAPTPEEPAPAPPPAQEPPTSAVIGRYEADGTSYVMYADGSIEAQSSAGVYRFGSMAELKSFIES